MHLQEAVAECVRLPSEGVVAEATLRGGWPFEVAYGAVLIASALIAYLAVRTISLLVRGRLLPPG